jgi:hypothetical protein
MSAYEPDGSSMLDRPGDPSYMAALVASARQAPDLARTVYHGPDEERPARASRVPGPVHHQAVAALRNASLVGLGIQGLAAVPNTTPTRHLIVELARGRNGHESAVPHQDEDAME